MKFEERKIENWRRGKLKRKGKREEETAGMVEHHGRELMGWSCMSAEPFESDRLATFRVSGDSGANCCTLSRLSIFCFWTGGLDANQSISNIRHSNHWTITFRLISYHEDCHCRDCSQYHLSGSKFCIISPEPDVLSACIPGRNGILWPPYML